MLLVDAFSDLGPREGIDGRPTSLDVTVRAAGAISEHFLRSGDRLTLRTVGEHAVPGPRHRLRHEPPAPGARHAGPHHPGQRAPRHREHALRGVDPVALCLVLSPLIDQTMVSLAHTLAARGMTVVVVDTFPEHLVAGTGDIFQSLAWRMRLLPRGPGEQPAPAWRPPPVVP